MKYTQIPADTFSKLQMNAGIFCRTFNPETGEVSGLIGATTGGGSFTAAPEFIDFGEDIDNCPKNTMELKRLDDVAVTMSTTFVTIDPDGAKMTIGAADVYDMDTYSRITPRRDLSVADFADVWWVGDYSNINTGTGAGFCAIHLMNALSTGGFQLQTGDKTKGNFAMELTGHYSMSTPNVVPYDIYIGAGTDSSTDGSINLSTHTMTVKVGESILLSAYTRPVGQTVTFESGTPAKATISEAGLVTGVAAGSTIISATITVNGVSYSDTCTVIVVAAA